jgi:hypothetical protein
MRAFVSMCLGIINQNAWAWGPAVSTLCRGNFVLQSWRLSARHKKQRWSMAAPLCARPQSLMFPRGVCSACEQKLPCAASSASSHRTCDHVQHQGARLTRGSARQGDAEHILQLAMCTIERYCPLVVRYNCAFCIWNEIWWNAEWLQRH